MKKKITIKFKLDPTRRKMSAEELRAYLREQNRGCGVHGIIKNKTTRRKERQKIKQEHRTTGKTNAGFFIWIMLYFLPP